jgi:HPt (histidine-containing phosphotransfer) domain-containing protein
MTMPVNLSNLRDMTGGDSELEKELFQVFIESSEECLKHLQACCKAEAEEEWRKQAHAWKGMSFNLGADQLGDLCKDAQERHTAAVSEKMQMLSELQEQYKQVKQYLLGLISSS